MPDFRSPAERQNATHDQRHIGPTTDDAPEHRTGAQFSSLSAWRAKVDRELNLMRKRIGDHMGAEGAGGDYPHPSQRVRSLWFGEGLGVLDNTGIKFMVPGGDPRISIKWVTPLIENIPIIKIEGELDPGALLTTTALCDGGTGVVQELRATSGSSIFGITTEDPDTSVTASLVVTNYGSSVSGSPKLFHFKGAPIVLEGMTSTPSFLGVGSPGSIWYDSSIVAIRTNFSSLTQNISLDGDWSEKTIASGAITITTSRHIVDTQSDAATDDLDTISGGTDGQLLILCAANGARDVVLKDGTGNLKLAGDCTLDNTEDTIMLVKSSTVWLELCRSNNGA